MGGNGRRPRDPIVEFLQDLRVLPRPPQPSEPPRDILRETTASTPELEEMDVAPGPRWMPVKIQIGLASALGAVGALMGHGDIPWKERALTALAMIVGALAFTSAITLIDWLVARHRRATKRPPLDFK